MLNEDTVLNVLRTVKYPGYSRDIVSFGLVKKIAVAHLATAPYGRAAQQALEKLGAWADAQPKLVIGENITVVAHLSATDTVEVDPGQIEQVVAAAIRKSINGK